MVAPLLGGLRDAMGAARAGHPVCRLCGRAITTRDECLRLRGGRVVHRRCTTYEVRGRR
jgi:hypothetical protein